MERKVKQFGLTRKELVAALVEDSIGYLTPRSAELHIEKCERGDNTCFCERCQWVFEGDLQKCLESATSRWKYLSEEKRQRVFNLVERISKLDSITQTTIGLMWPTMV
jgi:hypothetical protein